MQQTLCMPLWGRAIAAEKYPSLFPDHDAGRIVKEMGVDWSDKKLYRFQYMWMCCLIRQYNMAWEVRNYLKEHPRAAVVELGAGLSCLRRQMGNETNPWYCLDMENVIPLREKHIPPGKLERNVVCDLNDFSWFDRIDFRPEDGIVFTAGGLFYYFEKEQVRRLLCAMAERFPGGMATFDAVNAAGLKGVPYKLYGSCRVSVKQHHLIFCCSVKKMIISVSEEIQNIQSVKQLGKPCCFFRAVEFHGGV